MRNQIQLVVFIILALTTATANAQDDMMNLLNQDTKPVIDYTSATFKATRVVVGQSCENPPTGDLIFMFSHHFGALNTGYDNLFGLKQSQVRLGLEYGATPWLGFGVGLNTIQNTWDGFLKFKVLRQSKGGKRMPFTLDILTGTSIYTTKWANTDRKNYFSSRISYSDQVILARKFGQRFSLQIMPTYVHINLVPTTEDHNNVFSLGAGGRVKISQRVAINAEYYYLIPKQIRSTPATSALSVGIDIDTGGHIFQVFLTNAMGENTESVVTQTTGKWQNGNIFLGFNISRIFTVVKPKEFRKKK
jgi:opacity protein-like surface antigen